MRFVLCEKKKKQLEAEFVTNTHNCNSLSTHYPHSQIMYLNLKQVETTVPKNTYPVRTEHALSEYCMY